MRKVLWIFLLLLFPTLAFGADRDEFRRSQFEDGADNEVLIQYGNTGTGHAVEMFDGTVSGGNLIYRLYQNGTLAQIEAIVGLYLNYTVAGGVGGGRAIFGMPNVPNDPTTPISGMNFCYFKDGTLYWIDDVGTVNQVGVAVSAPLNATYITQTPNASLTAEQAINSLSDGILKHASGVLAQAVAGTDYTDPTDYDAIGDLFVGSSDDAYSRLGIGNDNEVLTADSAEGLGMKWAQPSTTVDEFNIDYVAPATTFAEFDVMDVQMDVSALAASSGVHALNVAATNTTSGEVSALGVHAGVSPVHQHVGTFATPSQTEYAGEIPSGGGWSDGIDGNTIFEADDDEIYIGSTGIFSSLEVILSTVSSQDQILAIEYQHTDTTWDAFIPGDGTNGFRQNGVITWAAGSLTGWKSDSDPGGADASAGYWIRLRRTRNTVVTDPIVTTIKLLEPDEYVWDENGNISANSLADATDNVLMVPLEYANVQLAEDAAIPGDIIDISPYGVEEAVVVDVNNITLRGHGLASLIDGGSTGSALTITSDGVTVIDLALENTPGAAGGAVGGILANGVNDLDVIRVTVNDSDGAGFQIVGTSTRIRFIACTVLDADTFPLAGAAVAITDVLVSGCTFLNPANNSFTIQASSDFWRIVGNYIADGSTNAVSLAAASDDCVVDGNYLGGGAVTDAGTNNVTGDNT